MRGLSGTKSIFSPEALNEYERAACNPNVVAAWCGDYSAAASIDLEHDRANVGETSDIPCLILWGSNGVIAHHVDPLETWQNWFPNAKGDAIDAGHFLVEERPDDVFQAIWKHLDENR